MRFYSLAAMISRLWINSAFLGCEVLQRELVLSGKIKLMLNFPLPVVSGDSPGQFKRVQNSTLAIRYEKLGNHLSC